jgi:outer membrane protein
MTKLLALRLISSTMLRLFQLTAMKSFFSLLFGALLISSAAAAPTKIGIIDMDRIYREYHKTKSNEAELEKVKAEAKAEVDKRLKKFESIRTDFMERQKTMSNTQLAAGVRQKAEKEAQGMAAELETLRRDINEFARRRQAQIADQLSRMRKDILADLHTFVADKSKTSGYDLVFDKSGVSTSGIEILLFSKDAIDFTDDLLKDVNKDAGAAVKPAAPTP